MPFGLQNAPETFQLVVDIILSKVKWQFALVYLDDVIIYPTTFEEHTPQVRAVLHLLQAAGITLRTAKRAFFETSVDCIRRLHPTR